MDHPSPEPLVYRIDAADRLTYVNDAWLQFARNNQGESVMPELVLGRKMWVCVSDETVRALYQQMIERARAGWPVQFTYRCDAPAKRRTFAMEIRRVRTGVVEFVSTLLHEEARPPVALLEPGRKRDERFAKICSWCQKVAMPDGTWVPVEAAVKALHLLESEQMPHLTHGICAPCEAKVMASLSAGGGDHP